MAIKLAVVTAIDATMVGLVGAQLKAAKEAGFEVHGVCSEGPNFQKLREKGIIMKAVRIKRSMSPLSDLVSVWKMCRYFKREKIIIVHTHTPKGTLLGQLAAKLAGVPIIINTAHGFCFHEQMKTWPRRFFRVLYWFAAGCPTFIITQNPVYIDTAARLGIGKPDRVKLLGNGVDLAKFEPARFDVEFKKNKRKEIGVTLEATVVGIIGRLRQEKGYYELFQAMKSVMDKYQKVWLVIIGPEEPEKADRVPADAFKRYGLADRTVWLGKRPDIPELLACFDIYTLPSWREGFPRSAIEAAAMSLPIVATNIRGCRQVVDDGVTGLLVKLHSVEELAEAIIKLVNDKNLRRQMGRLGYEKSRREFDESKVCRIVIDTYKNLLKNCLQITI